MFQTVVLSETEIHVLLLMGILTAGCSGGRGVSNCGVIRDRDSCFTPNCSYALKIKIAYYRNNQ